MMMITNKQVARDIIARIARNHGWGVTRAVEYTADRIGVQPRTIWRWMRGTHYPTPQNQYAISYAQRDEGEEVEIVSHEGQPWRLQARAAYQAGLNPKIVKIEDVVGWKGILD